MIKASIFTAIACVLILGSQFFFNYYIGATILACTVAGCTYGYKIQGHIDYRDNVLRAERSYQRLNNVYDEFYLAT